MRNKSTIVTSFGQSDDDDQFALAIQESFKTLPPGFDVEEFERCEQNVPAQINPSESASVDEQAMSANPAVQETSALNLETLASAVSILEKLLLQQTVIHDGPSLYYLLID